ncbi:MAG: ABC transporter substrate-binding protein [Actinomycetota bacterium]|nr:ABC transporter substrate-binding protein [Actinomycetota bacterium]
MKQRKRVFAAALTAGALLLAACGGDDDNGSADTTTPAPETTEGSTETTEGSTETTEPAAPEGWAVDTEACVDPDAANAPIEGSILIGSAMPLSGGAAAAAWAPVKDGFEAYIKYANDNNLLEGVTIEVAIEDDQYNAELTPGAVSKLIDAGADIFSGIIGSPHNAAVRGTLNDNCIPQLAALTGSPAWGDVAGYPWTTGQLAPYTVESYIYAAQIAELYPDGANVSLFHVNTEFGQVYVDAFTEIADEYGITIVSEETIEGTDSAPPVAQVTNIAAEAPDVIMAVPLGAQCISFLTEVANAKAANAGWTPAVFLTNTCASSLILGASGAGADGIYTSGNLIDVADPANAEVPEVAEYLAFMEAQGKSDVAATAGAGWTAAETTVAILIQAAASPEGLTQASIINAARNFTYEPTLGIDGVVFTMSGEEDAYLAESLVVRQYDADTATFTDIGELITEFES